MDFKTLRQLSQNYSILYIEDYEIIRYKTAAIFKELFKIVDVAKDGIDGLDMYNSYYESTSKYYDIVVSDIKMPGLNGIELTKKIFEINKKQVIIIVSAYDDKEYLVELINLGAHGFMKKPFTSSSLIKILFDTCNLLKGPSRVSFYDGFVYDIATATLYQNEKKIELSTSEIKLLHLLLKNKNQSFSAISIFNHIYFDEPDKEFSVDSIKSLVKRLRKKLPKNFISNTPKLGYRANF